MKSLPVILSVLPLLGACATDPYGNNVEARTMGGALAGAAIGALGGQLIGVDPVTGAAAGLVVGGTAGYVTKNVGGHQRRYYKDASGYCYYVDANGLSHYDDPPVRC